MNELLNRLIGMSNKKIAYLGLVYAKAITISKPHNCSECNNYFEEYSVMCTASRYIDKDKNKTLMKVLDNGENPKDYKFVLQRHWICKDCLRKILDKKTTVPKRKKIIQREERIDIYSEEFNKLSLLEQLDAYEQAYENGELSAEEYEDIENAIIHHIALQEAEGIGQE